MAGKSIFERAQFVQQPCDVLQTPTSIDAKVIRILHPGYADRKNAILRLNCTDNLLDGLYHGLVHAAASIIAGNRFDGYLSYSREGAKVSQAIHELLPAGDYYFLLPSCVTSSQDAAFQHDYSLPYPIFASFHDWLYPHDRLPQDFNAWPRLSVLPALSKFSISQHSMAVRCRDETCRLTGAIDPCESAHLIPVGETRWFDEQIMSEYANKPDAFIHDSGNLFLLRNDIHKLLDTGKWIPYPKTVLVNGSTETRLVFHSLEYLPQLRELYQNAPLRETQGLRPEYLLARFAFAIFPRVQQFLRCGAGRYLIRVNVDAQTGKSEFVNGSELVRTYPVPGVPRGSRTPSHSPTKRSRGSIMDQFEHSTTLEELNSIWKSSRQKHCRSASEEKQTRLNPHLSKRRRNVSDPPPTKNHEEVDHFSFIHYRRLRDGPCQCPSSSKDQELLTPISSPASIQFVEESNFWHSQRRIRQCDSRYCLDRMERERLTILRENALHLERIKSGTDAWWKTVEEWYLRTMNRGGTMSQPTIRKWLWFQGAEELELIDDAGVSAGI